MEAGKCAIDWLTKAHEFMASLARRTQGDVLHARGKEAGLQMAIEAAKKLLELEQTKLATAIHRMENPVVREGVDENGRPLPVKEIQQAKAEQAKAAGETFLTQADIESAPIESAQIEKAEETKAEETETPPEQEAAANLSDETAKSDEVVADEEKSFQNPFTALLKRKKKD
jgi:hypothetical protein